MCIPMFGMPLDATGTLFCFWMLRAPHISKTLARLLTMAVLTKGGPLAFACFPAGMIIACCTRNVLQDAANLDTFRITITITYFSHYKSLFNSILILSTLVCFRQVLKTPKFPLGQWCRGQFSATAAPVRSLALAS